MNALRFLMALSVVLGMGAFAADVAELESAHLKNIRQITLAGSKNGEAYFSADGKQIIFQGVRESDNPFYQIYRMNLSTGEVARVSTGVGKTTCAFFNPVKPRVIFASTHLDPSSLDKQKEELERLRSGPPRRYSWDFDPAFDIFEADLDGKNPVRLTDAPGYDAEGSYSPDGKSIVFCSNRDGDYEIYAMDADGKNQRRLTHEKFYDGGPFFSPDGKKIIWRHFTDESQRVAEVWTMDADGSNKQQVTKFGAASWAPYYLPSMKWIVFASNLENVSKYEFDVYAVRPDGSELTRLTFAPGFDGLPVPSPDGSRLMWTSNRVENKSQLFMADLVLPGENPPEHPVEFKKNDEPFSDAAMVLRVTRLTEAAAAFHVEHTVAKQFHDAGLMPFGQTENIEDTFFIYGPRVTGWLPPQNGADGVVVAAANMQSLEWSPWGVAALSESIKFEKQAREKTKDAKLGGVYFSVPNVDDVDAIYKDALSDMKKMPLKISAFVSTINLGKMRGRKLQIIGTGTGNGWRDLAERLAALHPEVSIELVDSPEGAPELKQFTDNKIPAVAFGALDAAADKQDQAPAQDDSALIGAAATVGDALRLLASGEVKIAFTAYDPVAVKAAQDAARRPYLGTVPDMKAEGIAGVKLSDIHDGSPAQKAGLKAGDIVVELAGKPVKNASDYLAALESLKVGDETTLKFQRDGKTETVKVTLGAR
ncbi:MAG TPA: PDZ domain-containing protein [Planctomycetota bacterium]|nr:PDZ domain-containing protein [Planctomycetota bacterium]